MHAYLYYHVQKHFPAYQHTTYHCGFSFMSKWRCLHYCWFHHNRLLHSHTKKTTTRLLCRLPWKACANVTLSSWRRLNNTLVCSFSTITALSCLRQWKKSTYIHMHTSLHAYMLYIRSTTSNNNKIVQLTRADRPLPLGWLPVAIWPEGTKGCITGGWSGVADAEEAFLLGGCGRNCFMSAGTISVPLCCGLPEVLYKPQWQQEQLLYMCWLWRRPMWL